MKTKTWTCSFLSKIPSGPVEFIKDGELMATVVGIEKKKIKKIVNVLNEISSLGLSHFQLRTLDYLIDRVLNSHRRGILESWPPRTSTT